MLLERQGHRVLVSTGVSEALSLLAAQPVDLVIAECQQLEANGGALFRLFAHWPRPPMILPTTSHPATGHATPAVPDEVERAQDVLAQVQRLLTQPHQEVMRVGELAVDSVRKQVLFHGQPVLLPPIQFRLLAYLTQNTGRVVSAQELLKAVWGYEGDETEARELVKVHVRQIRRRLGLEAHSAEYVQSVRGFGYIVTAPTPSPPR